MAATPPNLNLPAGNWPGASGAGGPAARAGIDRQEHNRQADELVIPLAREELRVDLAHVETGRVVVDVGVRTHEEVVRRPVVQEHVHVERVPVHAWVERAPEIRREGNTVVVPIVEEVVVVQKRLRVREEIRITRTQQEAMDMKRVPLRSEHAVIRRVPPERAQHEGPPHNERGAPDQYQ